VTGYRPMTLVDLASRLVGAAEWAEMRVLQQPWFRRNWKSSAPMHCLGPSSIQEAWRLPVRQGPGRRVSEADSILFGREELERHSPRWLSASSAEASWQTSSLSAVPLWHWPTTLPASPAMSIRCSPAAQTAPQHSQH
jgi:hypothetical protein